MRNRTSPIWKPSKEEFVVICKSHASLAQIIRSFGLEAEAGNYNTLKRRLQEEGVDISHIKMGLNSNRGRRFVVKYTQENISDAINRGVIKDSSTVKKMVPWRLSISQMTPSSNNTIKQAKTNHGMTTTPSLPETTSTARIPLIGEATPAFKADTTQGPITPNSNL